MWARPPDAMTWGFWAELGEGEFGDDAVEDAVDQADPLHSQSAPLA